MRVKLSETRTVQYFVEHVCTPSARLTDKGKPHMVPTGVTQATVFDETGAVLGRGRAKRHPNDPFRKHTGTSRALARALEGSGLTKGERKLVWSRVWNGRYDDARTRRQRRAAAN
jgi:hypothetical protein